MTGTTETLLDSNLRSVDAAEALVLEASEASGLDEETRADLGLAVREAMVNAVVHGNKYDPSKKVRLIVDRTMDKLRITILDEGSGFDPGSIADPTRDENLLRESGRGLLLIQTFVDEFSVRKAASGGTEVQLIKFLS